MLPRPPGKGRAERDQWVRIGWTVLSVGARAPQVPEDTREVPLVARASGWLDDAEAAIGDEVTIRTAAGRRLTGSLVEIEPAPGHGFGEPVAELLAIGPQLRRRLGRAGSPSRSGLAPFAGSKEGAPSGVSGSLARSRQRRSPSRSRGTPPGPAADGSGS